MSLEHVEHRILMVRGHRVMFDSDLAKLYGVPTKRLNEQVRRNPDRFPPDFAFPLTAQEVTILRSQNATSRSSWGGPRYLPYVFTEHGSIMAANVLSSPQAIKASICVVRAFIHLRELLASHKDLARKLEELEQKYDAQFKVVFDAIRALMAPPPEAPRERIGFRP
jgi:hypothetical protein